MKRFFAILMAAVMLLGMLAGCGKSGGDSKSTSTNGSPDGSATNTLTTYIGTDVSTMDPRRMSSITDMAVSNQIFDTLYFVTLDHQEQPRLAESYTVSDDGSVYTFTLRKGVRFHNGEELKASDAVFSFNEAKASPFTSSYVDDMKSCRAVDDYTFEVTLSAPNAIFIQYVAGIKILNEKATTEAGDSFGDNPVGCGPYKLVSHTNASEVKLARFDDYYRGPARIETVIFKVISDSNTAAIALQTGEVDLGGINASAYSSIESDADLDILRLESAHISYVIMNTEVAPFNDVRVRQAINYAINKEFVVEAAAGGYARVANTVLAPEVFGYDASIKGYEYNVEKAKELLKEAGITTPVDFPPIKTIDGTFKVVAQAVQSDLAAIGINTTIEVLEANKYLEDAHGGNYSLGIMGLDVGYDADLFSNMYATCYINGYNMARYSNSWVDEMFDKGHVELDSTKRQAIYTELFRFLDEEAVYAPLFNQVILKAHDKDLQIDYIEPINYYMYDMAWK